jgi:hypothetical protein
LTSILGHYLKEIDGDDYDPNGTTFVHRFGQGLNKGSEFGGMFNLNASHWVAGADDLMNEKLWYGDPTWKGIDPTVVSAFQWFIAKHVVDVPVDTMEQKCMLTTMQILHYDWWQCGLLAHNGLANLYLPDQNPLLLMPIFQLPANQKQKKRAKPKKPVGCILHSTIRY